MGGSCELKLLGSLRTAWRLIRVLLVKLISLPMCLEVMSCELILSRYCSLVTSLYDELVLCTCSVAPSLNLGYLV